MAVNQVNKPKDSPLGAGKVKATTAPHKIDAPERSQNWKWGQYLVDGHQRHPERESFETTTNAI